MGRRLRCGRFWSIYSGASPSLFCLGLPRWVRRSASIQTVIETPPPPTSPRGLATAAGLSAVDIAFSPVSGADEAREVVRRLALGHYENFSVVSFLVPRNLRQDFCNIYAFCRTADDLGDELGDPAESLRRLGDFRNALLACYDGKPVGAVFTTLRETVARHDIPAKPFLDLISAFEQDQRVSRYDTHAQLVDYCTRSADPVGRLVLYLAGYADEPRQRLSDHTCTALQLTNFWQDVSRDLHRIDRVYLPRESMDRFGVTEGELRAGVATPGYRNMIRSEVDRTEAMFAEGDKLLPMLIPSVAAHVSLFSAGGRAVLRAIRDRDYDTLSHRPTISARRKLGLVARAFSARALGVFSGLRRRA